MSNIISSQVSEIATSQCGEIVNDKHSQLNQTPIKQRLVLADTKSVRSAVLTARANKERICVAGGRHAMGGQQFLHGGVLIDSSAMNKVISFDEQEGLIEAESGICWPDLIDYLKQRQRSRSQWSIAQKQTGCDRLSLGGAISANIHGRGLRMAPFISDVEEFTIVMANGEVVKCSRRQNSELFKLAIGGYGLFGIVVSAKLRLVKKTILRRSVEIIDADNVVSRLEELAEHGATYGDFQFAIDDTSRDFLQLGILSTYTPVEASFATQNKLLSTEDWHRLLHLAHTDKAAAYQAYSKHYLSTNGQLYDSDMFQLATYVDNYHSSLDKVTGAPSGTELISELYVPRAMLPSFLREAAESLRKQRANVIYGTVRMIEKDTESFLAWATQNWACIVLNLHVEHTQEGIASARRSFGTLIDLATKFGGSYYLTYHRFASRQQLLSCYPQIPQFFNRKLKYDPEALFCSDWYEHTRTLINAH